VREVRELGVKGTLARGLWEIKTRSGLARLGTAEDAPATTSISSPSLQRLRLPFEAPARVREAMEDVLDAGALAQLTHEASESTRGRIRCFSTWLADYGNPIDWHRDPLDGHRYAVDAHWAEVLRDAGGADVKFVWEAARFPHAYVVARAAALCPESAGDLALAGQITDFVERNPPGIGVHWFSGQEVALRLMAWLFGFHVLGPRMGSGAHQAIVRSLASGGAHLMAHLAYARDSVYNNHLLSESLGLYLAGWLTPGPAAAKWSAEGLRHLTEQAGRQVYEDGGYIQQSHNYHRVAMHLYLWAAAFAAHHDERVPAEWTGAMERSLDFLLAHQNPRNGWLPNYGANDSSLPLRLTSCELADFRPVLQALSVATRGERLYDRGPWDELAIWLFGARSADLPLRRREARSVSFEATGYHVLRGAGADSFCAFRCGTLRDRFSQIDMLHVDVWWRGLNVLADSGTHRYNGAPEWHSHFLRTGSHNTISLDGRDQMLHIRQFKTLYRTEARTLRFEDAADLALVEGEQYGYRRELHCTHRRAVLFAKDDLWIVADAILGSGTHTARLHWLAGNFPFEFHAADAQLALDTPEGLFTVTVLDDRGEPCAGADVVAGSNDPPRGWLSRVYGEKIAVPSLAAIAAGDAPLYFVSVLCAGKPSVRVKGAEWTVSAAERTVRFRLDGGSFTDVVSAPAELRV
jgi:asparagine synthase (glutamine-hydrolysing)